MKSRLPGSWLPILLVLSGLAVLTAYVFGGQVGGLATLVYLTAVALPGSVLYLAVETRFGREKLGIAEAFLFSNLLGLALSSGSAWILARASVFSVPGTLAIEAAVVAGAVGLSIREWRVLLREGLQSRFAVDIREVAFLGTIGTLAVVLLLPLLRIYSQGLLISGDTATYSLVGDVVARTGAWPSLSQVLMPYTPQSTTAPGLPMLYALFANTTGSISITIAGPFELLSVVLLPVALYLLILRFCRSALLAYALATVWLVSATTYGQMFYNYLLAASYANIYPDQFLSLVAFLAALFLLVDLLRGHGGQWAAVILLASAVLVGTMFNQLTFFFMAVVILLFGVPLLFVRGVGWTLRRAIVVALPTAVLLPSYLLPANLGSTTATAQAAPISLGAFLTVDWTKVDTQLGLLGTIAILLVVIAGGWAAVLAFRRPRGPGSPAPPRGLFALIALGFLGFYLSITGVGYHVFGANDTRFYEYVGLAWVPVVAYALDNLRRIRLPRLGAKPAAIAAASLLLVAGAVGITANERAASALADSALVSSSDVRTAGEWLAAHAPPSAVVAGDANAGPGALQPLRDYSGLRMVVRPEYDLYDAIHLVPSPANLSVYYANLVMTSPTASNASAASDALSMDYYVFQVGRSALQIAAFSALPYFRLVYANPGIDIFQYVGGSGPGFIPAIAYADASPAITRSFSIHAYAYAVSMPHALNMVTSTNDTNGDNATATYSVQIATSGSYTLNVHQYVYQSSEYLNVFVGAQYAGSIHYNATGPQFGAPVSLTLPAGANRLTFQFEGTVGSLDPVDYLVLSPS